MTVKDAVNRTNNLVSIAIVGLSGFAFLPEAFIEDKIPFKVDDALLFVLGLIAIIWYKLGNNRYTRSIAPVIFVVIALVIKIGAIIIEHTDKDDVGDDMGALILFVLSTILVVYLYKFSQKLLKDK